MLDVSALQTDENAGALLLLRIMASNGRNPSFTAMPAITKGFGLMTPPVVAALQSLLRSNRKKLNSSFRIASRLRTKIHNTVDVNHVLRRLDGRAKRFRKDSIRPVAGKWVQ